MKINFTKKQFETLLKLAYMGNWVVNSHRLFEGENKRMEKYDDIEKYLLSFAKEFGLEKYVDIDNEKMYPSIELEEDETDELIDEYDNETFWEELIDRFARRDFVREYGEEEISKMDTMERIKKDHPFLEKYQDEIYKYGIDRLEIVEDEENKK